MDNNYTTLEEITKRKQKLQGEIRSQEKTMRGLWNGLFHQQASQAIPTPSRRLTNLLTTGAGILDGALLGWKLYRKFKK